MRTISIIALFLAGTATAAPQDLLYTVTGGVDDGFGYDVTAIGDLNGDGALEYLTRRAHGATIDVFSVADGTLLFEVQGTSGAGVGDVDADGVPDFAASDGSQVRVYSGAQGAALYDFFGEFGDVYGAALGSAGDLDGDGHDDVFIGAPQVEVHCGGDVCHYISTGPGYAEVRSGADGSLLRTFSALANYDGAYGEVVGNAGDLDADGVDDLFVGGGGYIGFIDLYSGASGARIRRLRTSGGVSPERRRAIRMAAEPHPDVDGDGVPELILGEPIFERVRVVSGATGRDIHVLERPSNNHHTAFGSAVASIGDVDGDGVADFAAGALYFDDDSGGRPGILHVVSGRSGSILWSLLGDSRDQQFGGGGVCAAGDVDQDGVADLVISAYGTDQVRVHSGAEGFSSPRRSGYSPDVRIDVTGSASIAANDFRLRAEGGVAPARAVFVYGPNLDGDFWPGETFIRAVGAPRQRLRPAPFLPDGTVELAVDLDAPAPGAEAILVGSTLHFQCWVPGPELTASDAISVTFVP